MKIRIFLEPLLVVVAAGLLLSASSFAQADKKASPATKADKDRKVYIVQLADKPLAAYDGDIAGLAATKPGKNQKLNTRSARYHSYAGYLKAGRERALASVPGARTIHEYQVAFNGFAALMTEREARQLKSRGEVVRVWEDRLLKPHTNSTPNFLRMTGILGPWFWGFTGEDVVIGVLDGGIHPEHPSLADVKTPRRGNRGRKIPYGSVPQQFVGSGCEFGNTDFNPLDAAFDCNNKLIKAQAFPDAFLAFNTLADGEFLSARDSDGHGTHTATTAGGNFGVDAEIDGESLGTVSGMAPRARVAVYKVCWDAPDPNDSGCFSSDSMAAIDQAVADGVDVINFSIGGPSTSFNGPDDIAFLFAADAGVFVSVSAGNSGPEPDTIGTPSGVPWVTSVAAAEDNENFATGLQLDAPASLADTYEGLEGSGPVSLADSGTISGNVVPAEPLDACTPLSNGDDMAGQIALVIRGVCSFSIKYNEAAAAGALAIVVYNDGTAPDRIDPIVMGADDTTIPGIMISHTDGEPIAGASDTAGTLSPEIQVARVNRITGFSSRGANGGATDIIKPDVAAPGVGIVAGETLFPNVNANGGQLFQAISGTSMSSPHVAGTMALLKQAHPDWTAAMAKSALMTSARQNMRKTFGPDAADPFDMGAGFIQPTHALLPGLVYDAGFNDYLAYMCGAESQPGLMDLVPAETCDALESAGFSLDSSDLNLASIGVGSLLGSQTVTRTITSVTPGKHWYWVSVDAPEGIDVSVSPPILKLKKGESASYQVTFSTTGGTAFGEWAFGSLTWHSVGGFIDAHSPIAVLPAPMAAPTEVRSTGTDGSLSFDVDFGFVGPYEVGMAGLTEATSNAGAVEDQDQDAISFEVPEGTAMLRVALFDEDVGVGNGSDDLDVFLLLGSEFDGVLIGQSTSPTSEESITIANPPAGEYTVIVSDFASAAGPTQYILFNFVSDGTDVGNTVITAPSSSNPGGSGTVTVDWSGLSPGTRALGFLSHGDGVETFAETELLINTQ